MHRASAVFVVLLTALLVGACGSYGDGANAKVETSVANSLKTVIDAQAPLVELRSVDCAGTRPTLDCLASLGVGNTVVQVRFAVVVGADDCWVADARRTVVLGAGSETNPLTNLTASSNLKGCIA